MEAWQERQKRMLSIQFFIPFLQKIHGLAEVIHAPCLHAAHAHIRAGSGNALRRKVHIKNRSNSAGQVFQNCQLRQMVDVLLR